MLPPGLRPKASRTLTCGFMSGIHPRVQQVLNRAQQVLSFGRVQVANWVILDMSGIEAVCSVVKKKKKKKKKKNG
eukprot:NODE_15337_length_1055_cov_5.385776.p5 GENE.NODE_15337_length_1055_cov_5.385776~~NODE_15337_length_1055_cov_5.385776.p5  ORF type:complete len:75 (+),score=37.86 NODE_15337_length_1055_cov_5.385776:713-937(+)